MSQDTDRSFEIQKITGLQPKHFADLVRVAQLVDDPAGGLTGRLIQVNWDAFGISPGVVENLKVLGAKYRYSSPYVAIAAIVTKILLVIAPHVILLKSFKKQKKFPIKLYLP
jgi:hypothetical protein